MDTKKVIELHSVIKVVINDSLWIGQVVEIEGDSVLVRLLDNLHYRAQMNELALI